ncbi:MAG TPA: NUDIX hydrolase [Thermomicrobiales bacterium]|jgi:mutator protein MutT
MVLVAATTLLGRRKLVPKASLIPRRSAYGVILDGERRLLLVNTRSTGKWSFPGGRCDEGETDAEATIREVREETGITVVVGEVLAETENYWYDDTVGVAYFQRSTFLRCHPLTYMVTGALNLDAHDEAEHPTWVPLAQLTPDDFQGFWGEILRLLQ